MLLPEPLTERELLRRAARDLPDGMHVSLGIGLPRRIPVMIDSSRDIFFLTENGADGIVPLPQETSPDPDLIDASTEPVAVRAGAAFFDCATSFAMLRGGHVKRCLLGAFEVSEGGDLASWSRGVGGATPAVGGAMDIATGVPDLRVVMTHTTSTGRPRLVRRCSLPLTAKAVVQIVYTDIGTLACTQSGFVLIDEAPGWPRERVCEALQLEVSTSDEGTTA